MNEHTFHPMPSRPKRGAVRWILLALHALLFAGVVFGYPTLVEINSDIFTGNTFRLGVPVWGLVVVGHTVLVALLDLREDIIHTRKERRWRREYERQQKEQAK